MGEASSARADRRKSGPFLFREQIFAALQQALAMNNHQLGKVKMDRLRIMPRNK
jgi:hypothetical protein